MKGLLLMLMRYLFLIVLIKAYAMGTQPRQDNSDEYLQHLLL